jgi:hypothetical protein
MNQYFWLLGHKINGEVTGWRFAIVIFEGIHKAIG